MNHANHTNHTHTHTHQMNEMNHINATDHPRIRLFCLPYAGGSARLYQGWQRELPDFVEVCPLELPGRGSRFREPLSEGLEPLVDDVVAAVRARSDLPFALFGYSFGSLLAYEAALRLEAAGSPPVSLTVAAFRSPGSAPPKTSAAFLPDAEFREVVGEMGGTPRELLESDAFMELALPIIRADLRIAATYGNRQAPSLSCPVAAFAGADDHLFAVSDVAAWARHTSAPFTLHVVPGDHFFLHSHPELLWKTIGAELTELC
ncbi:thioesterase II family protein [Streptomyces apocyni]|uniref:thioesterase II family protein n=1 Tax=Streptomyces apocyni TaxID=2654677 RepID=UPI0012EAC188|nr:alpha/beta fold hydrolase [Streptomyces apocyni]